MLVFLLPLVIAYELGLMALLRYERGVKAHQAIVRFFEAFGVAPSTALLLGGVVVIVVLLLWHILNRDPWRIDWPALAVMACESLMLSLPLLVISQFVAYLPAAGVTMLGSTGSNPMHGLDLGSRIVISVGAGLYEELLFRMLLIAVIHTLLVDIGKASHRMGMTIGVVVSAAAFAAYHLPVAPREIVFLVLAGLYLGAVFVVRGFGIVVGAHALYDVMVSFLTPAS
jgi:hypothetical protein